MTYPVVPLQPPLVQGDPFVPSQRADVTAAGAAPTLAQDAEVVVLGPGNTGLPVVSPKIVQKASAVSSGTVASLACAFTNPVQSGNSIVVVTSVGNNGANTIADTLSNTYNKAVLKANSTTFETGIYFATPSPGGANTVTVTPSATVEVGIQLYEVSGMLAQVAGQPDTSSSNTGTSATASATAISASSPNSIIFEGVAVGTAAQAISVVSGTSWTLDSTQNVGGSPTNLFTVGALSQYLANLYPIIPQATLASSEPFAIAAAIFKPVVMGVQGTVNLASDYPYGATPITADSGNVAAGTATATLAAVAGKTTYITGYVITASGATAASVVTGTITGLITGTQHFTYTAIAGATLACQTLVVTLPKAAPASAVNTAIAVALPSLGSGNTNTTVNAYGYQL